MKRLICSATVVAVALLFASAGEAFAEPAASPLTVCNQLPNRALVAVGYFSSGVSDTANTLSGPFVSRGWWPVQPGECQTFPNPFNARYMFWYAFDTDIASLRLNDNDLVVMGMRILPGVHMCVTDYFDTSTIRAFTYEDENVSKAACDQASGDGQQKDGNALWVIPNKVDTLIQSKVNITAQ